MQGGSGVDVSLTVHFHTLTWRGHFHDPPLFHPTVQTDPTDHAFAEFVRRDGRFIRGSLRVFAFDSNGVCHAYGDRHNLIWRNLFEVTDDDGKLFVKELIERARAGADTVRYRLNGEPVLAYVEPVVKDSIEYVVGSSYYE